MRIAIVFGLALAVAACDEDDGDPSNYVAATELDRAYKTAYCTYAARCGLFPDAATCKNAALQTGILSYQLTPNQLAAINVGRIAYQGSNVKKCFDAIAAQTCDKSDRDGRVLGSLAACLDILRGTLGSGASCTLDEECISQTCAGGSEVSCTMGTCVGDIAPSYIPATLGQPCSPFCGDGLWCDFNTDTCQPLKAAATMCAQNDECDYGLLCVTDSTGTIRTCKAAPTVGQPCPDFTCRDEGQFCSSTTQTCTQLGLPPTTCTSSTTCSPYYPCDFTTQQCKKGPGLGQSCSTTNRCFDAGTYCDSLTLLCVVVKADGQQCTSDTECESVNCDTTMVPAVCTSPMTCFP